ncbi:hypothetical protein C8R43DRAFT_961336 [Mycena crocata]|nr:hypothetical protein C8R43DRAFT_961336 [Mycena crocata]
MGQERREESSYWGTEWTDGKKMKEDLRGDFVRCDASCLSLERVAVVESLCKMDLKRMRKTTHILFPPVILSSYRTGQVKAEDKSCRAFLSIDIEGNIVISRLQTTPDLYYLQGSLYIDTTGVDHDLAAGPPGKTKYIEMLRKANSIAKIDVNQAEYGLVCVQAKSFMFLLRPYAIWDGAQVFRFLTGGFKFPEDMADVAKSIYGIYGLIRPYMVYGFKPIGTYSTLYGHICRDIPRQTYMDGKSTTGSDKIRHMQGQNMTPKLGIAPVASTWRLVIASLQYPYYCLGSCSDDSLLAKTVTGPGSYGPGYVPKWDCCGTNQLASQGFITAAGILFFTGQDSELFGATPAGTGVRRNIRLVGNQAFDLSVNINCGSGPKAQERKISNKGD